MCTSNTLNDGGDIHKWRHENVTKYAPHKFCCEELRYFISVCGIWSLFLDLIVRLKLRHKIYHTSAESIKKAIINLGVPIQKFG